MVTSTLKVTWRNHYAPLSNLFFRLAGFLAYVVYSKFDPVIVFATIIVWSIDALPALFLHTQYWLKNKHEEYVIRNDELILNKQGVVTHYKNEDIHSIFIYLPPPAYRNSKFNLLLIGFYHFAIIRLKSKEALILTNLLSRSLEADLKQINGVKVSRFKCTFCSLS